MSDDAKLKATLDARGRANQLALDAEPALPTMQMPAGVVPTEAAAPLMQTVMPVTGTPLSTRAPPAMPGDWRYQITTEIARGGMGRVVEATDTVLGRTVALKEALSLDPESLRRFQRETRITARLEHPSIVPVHDAGTSPDGSPYYVMRKVSGRPLEQLVAQAANLEDRLALVHHIVATTHAIAHAHARGIVHRDIKPANILIGDTGETIVIDWGLAKAIGEPDSDGWRAAPNEARAPTAPLVVEDSLRTRVGIVFGTPGFMAPEQLRGASVDERCDVYALGATLYHLLARRPPHYSGSGDEMMKAAVAGPPTPLRDIVPGVPPELATIVDKALAHDATIRYQDAGALAEDLNRFLTGQLVASHHYSPGEKVGRFISKHRVPVSVAIAAALAMIVGGWVAVRRIVSERDRADVQARIAVSEKHVAEQQRQEVSARVDQLTLKEARRNAESNPTLATAMVKPLTSKLWRSVRAVAGAARTSGVAFGMAASPRTSSLQMSRDGQRVLAGGDDGVVRIYDLPHRSSRIVASAKAKAVARFADGERKIVLFHGKVLTIIDALHPDALHPDALHPDALHPDALGVAPTAPRRDVIAETEILNLAVSGPIVYWVDAVGTVWTLDLASARPQKLVLSEAIKAVIPSPDGRWVALVGGEHLMLLDRTQPTLPPEVIFRGYARDLAWAADASHVVGLIEQEVIDINMMPSRSVVQSLTVGNRNAVIYNGGRLATAGPTGIAFPSRDESRMRKEMGDFTLGLREARGGVVVTGGVQGIIKVLSDDGDRTLQSPGGRISQIEASPSGGWIVAAGEGRLFAWDLDTIQPQHLTDPAPSGANFIGDDQAIVTYSDAQAQWLDVTTGKATSLGTIIPSLFSVVTAPDHQRALAIDGTHHARIVSAAREPIDIAGDIELAAFIDDRQLIVASSDGRIRIVGPRGSEPANAGERGPSAGPTGQQQQTELAHLGGPVVALAVTATGWVVAAAADRTLWRSKIGGHEATLTLTTPPPRGTLAMLTDGTAVFSTGRELQVWREGAVVASVLATFDKPVVSVMVIEPTKLLVLAADGKLSIVTVEGARTNVGRTIATSASFANDGMVASLSPAGMLEIYDPIVDEHWALATPRSGQAFSFAQISPDGRRVLAVTPQGLLVWTLALPHDPDGTAHWLDAMTNAISDDGRTLTWK